MLGHRGLSVPAPLTPVSKGASIKSSVGGLSIREVLEENLDLPSTPDTFEAARDLIVMSAQSLASYSRALAQVQAAQELAATPLQALSAAPIAAPPIQHRDKPTMMRRHSPLLRYHSPAPSPSAPLWSGSDYSSESEAESYMS
ncbi:unnamed protein product [Caretta caretta]